MATKTAKKTATRKTAKKKAPAKKAAKKTTARTKKKTPANRMRGVVSTDEATDRGAIGNGNGHAAGVFSEDGAQIEHAGPYTVHVEIEGIAPLLIHGYNVDLIEALDGLPKGAKEKKKDYPEHVCFWDRPFKPNKTKGFPFFHRDSKAILCGSTDWLHRAMVEAGRRHKDPSSAGGRKMAKELVAAGVIVTGEDGNADVTPFYTAGSVGGTTRRKSYTKCKTWDYLDKRRCVVGQAAVPRVRPAMAPGWRLRFSITVSTPEYIPVTARGFSLRTLVDEAGALQGLADYRPKFGRFKVVNWEVED